MSKITLLPLRLSECQRQTLSVSSVPPFHVAWVKRTKDSTTEKDVVSLPLYFTRLREKIVTCLDVPCVGSADTWIQAGAALFLKN